MIRRLEIHNFATHQDTEIEFGNGKNVIIGATGSGKTNLLQALDFAFMGEVPGTNLGELISDDSDAAEVILEYIELRTGQNYKIHRTLSRNADGKITHECVLTNLETNETVKKPIPIQNTLEKLGVVPSIFKHVVHIAQGSFSDLLEETQERKNTMDRLLQISQIENTYQELGRQDGPINRIELRKHTNLETKSKLEAFASNLDNEKLLLNRIIEDHQQKKSRLDEAQKELIKLEKISKKNLETLSTLQSVQEKIRSANATLETSSDQIKKLISTLKQSLSQDLCEIIKEQKSSDMILNLKTLKSNLNNLQKEVDHNNEKQKQILERVAFSQSEINLITEDKTNSLNQINGIQMYLEGKGEKPKIECDKCGSILTKKQWSIHIKEKLESLKSLDNKIEKLRQKHGEYNTLSDNYLKKCEEANNNIRNLTNTIFLLEEIITHRQQLEKASSSKIMFEEEKNQLVDKLRILLGAKPTVNEQEITDQALTLEHRLETLSKHVDELRIDILRFDENHLKPQEKRVEEAEEAASHLKELEPEIKFDEKKLSLLQTIRSALRDIQPAVRRNFVLRISQSANDYLTRLYGGAEIQDFEFTQDYEFYVTRAGYRRHANRLSGGQQVLASMSFLLALSEVLSQLDFLILDEPTTHLDTNRRIELVTVLENLRRVPQLIIVDHHSELFEAADTRFRISLTSEGHSQLHQTG